METRFLASPLDPWNSCTDNNKSIDRKYCGEFMCLELTEYKLKKSSKEEKKVEVFRRSDKTE